MARNSLQISDTQNGVYFDRYYSSTCRQGLGEYHRKFLCSQLSSDEHVHVPAKFISTEEEGGRAGLVPKTLAVRMSMFSIMHILMLGQPVAGVERF